MSAIGEDNSELFVTALSEIFENMELICEIEEKKDDYPQTLPSFKNFFDRHTTGFCSTPKRSISRFLKKKLLPSTTDDDVDSLALMSTPEEVARLVIPAKEPELPLPKLPSVILTPWSQMIRNAIQERENKLKKNVPAVRTQRMSMRI